MLIDRRLRNTSQLAGWAKRDDLAFLLREGFGIAFEHIESFAPTGELLDGYRALLIQREAAATGRALPPACSAPSQPPIAAIAGCWRSILPKN